LKSLEVASIIGGEGLVGPPICITFAAGFVLYRFSESFVDSVLPPFVLSANSIFDIFRASSSTSRFISSDFLTG